MRAQIAGRRIRRSEGGEATGEEVAVGGVAGQLQSPGVLGARLVRPVEPAQQVGPGRRQQVEAGQPRVQAGQQREPGRRAVHLGDRDRPVQPDHRRAGQLLQQRVERGDPGPVRLCRRDRPAVLGGDRGLQQVRPGAPAPRRRPQQGLALGDLPGVPAGPVLLGQQHQPPARVHPRVPAGVLQQQQREQAGRLRLVRHQRDHHPRQPDRLLAQLPPHRRVPGGRRVALGEDQVEHGQHAGQPVRQLGIGRHPVRDRRGGDLLLRPGDPRRHRRLRHHEGAGDLRRGQAAEQPERQRDPRLGGERRVAAGEQQPQPLVRDRRHILTALPGDAGARPGPGPGVRHHQQRQPPGQCRLPPEPVQGLAPRGGQQPRVGPVRHAVALPGRQRGRVRVLQRLLGHVQAADEPGEQGEQAPPVLPERPLHLRRRAHLAMAVARLPHFAGRTSTVSLGSTGIRFAHRTASSMVGTSTT